MVLVIQAIESVVQDSNWFVATLTIIVLVALARIYQESERLKRFTQPHLNYEFFEATTRIDKPLRTILITGGNGFLGKQIVMELLREYQNRVHIIVFDVILPTATSRNPYVSYCKANILNTSHIHRLFAAVSIESVFHCANIIQALNVPSRAVWMINVEGTKNILNASKLHQVKSFIYTSSVNVVLSKSSEWTVDLTDDMPYPVDHIDTYGKSKQAAELIISSTSDINGMVCCMLRPPGIFGKGDKMIADLFVSGAHKVIACDVNAIIELVSVENVAYAHVLAEKALQTQSNRSVMNGQTYFIGNNEKHTFAWFSGINSKKSLKSHWDQVPPVNVPFWVVLTFVFINEFFYYITGYVLLSPLAKFSMIDYSRRSYACPTEKAYKHFGYKPLLTISESIRRIVDDYKKSQLSSANITDDYINKDNGQH